MAEATVKQQEHFSRRRETLLKQLSNQKLWNKPYDPRALETGDKAKLRGKDPITLYLDSQITIGGKYDDLVADFRENIADRTLLDQYFQEHVNNRDWKMQPGCVVEYAGRNQDAKFDSDIFIFRGDKKPLQVPKDLANKYFQRPDLSYAIPRSNLEIIERTNTTKLADTTNIEALEKFLALSELEDPRLAPALSWIAEKFIHTDPAKQQETLDLLANAAPYIEWQRKYGISDPSYQFEFNERNEWQQLSCWVENLKQIKLDPDANTLEWETDAIYTHQSGYQIAPLELEEDFGRHGRLLRQCIAETTSQPYFAMQEEGHWQNYQLRDPSGYPKATVCLAKDGDKWVVLENRTTSNATLSPGSRSEGKPELYGNMIDQWFESLEIDGIEVSRYEENEGHAPEHPEYGLEAFGFSRTFDGELVEGRAIEDWDTEMIESYNRLGQIDPVDLDDLENYIEELTNNPEHFYNSEPEADYESEIWQYECGNEFGDINSNSLEDLVNEIVALAPAARDDQQVKTWAAGIVTLLHHVETSSDTHLINAKYEVTKLMEHLQDRALEEEPEIQTDLDINNQFHQHGLGYGQMGQQQLDVNEKDAVQWSFTFSKILLAANDSFEANNFHLPTPNNEDRGNYNGAKHLESLQEFLNKTGIEQTVELEISRQPGLSTDGQTVMFEPVMEENTPTWRKPWDNYRQNERVFNKEAHRWEEKPAYEHLDWKSELEELAQPKQVVEASIEPIESESLDLEQ